jgi:hypothetical protein
MILLSIGSKRFLNGTKIVEALFTRTGNGVTPVLYNVVESLYGIYSVIRVKIIVIIRKTPMLRKSQNGFLGFGK